MSQNEKVYGKKPKIAMNEQNLGLDRVLRLSPPYIVRAHAREAD